MSNTNTGGQAFPCLEQGGNGLELTDAGMTLRDYIAAKAMQGILFETFQTPKETARLAYEVADEMLKAREQ